MAIRSALARGRVARSEEGAAAQSVVLLLSVAVGGMLTLFESVHGVPVLVAIATLGLCATLVGQLERAQPWAAAILWATILVRTAGVALIPPLMMIAVCLMLAVGPDRVLDWISADWRGRRHDEPAAGWIEED